MEFTLEPTHEPQTASEQVPAPEPSPSQQSSVVKKELIRQRHVHTVMKQCPRKL